MMTNFVDGAARLFLHNIIIVGQIGVISVPLFNPNVALVVPNTKMTLGNFKPLVIQTVPGDSFFDFDFLDVSCSFISPD